MWAAEQEGFPPEPTDLVVAECPECHSASRRIGAQAFPAGRDRYTKSFFWECSGCGYVWATCPYDHCSEIGQPGARHLVKTTDGPMVVQCWKCIQTAAHGWHQVLDYTVEDILLAPLAEDLLDQE